MFVTKKLPTVAYIFSKAIETVWFTLQGTIRKCSKLTQPQGEIQKNKNHNPHQMLRTTTCSLIYSTTKELLQ